MPIEKPHLKAMQTECSVCAQESQDISWKVCDQGHPGPRRCSMLDLLGVHRWEVVFPEDVLQSILTKAQSV